MLSMGMGMWMSSMANCVVVDGDVEWIDGGLRVGCDVYLKNTKTKIEIKIIFTNMIVNFNKK